MDPTTEKTWLDRHDGESMQRHLAVGHGGAVMHTSADMQVAHVDVLTDVLVRVLVLRAESEAIKRV